MKVNILIACCCIVQCIYAQSFQFKPIDTGVNSSLRGLSVVDDEVIWASGSNGWVGLSLDGGENWEFKQVNGFETAGFRSVYAF